MTKRYTIKEPELNEKIPRLRFILGKGADDEDPAIKKMLDQEQMRYKDIVIADFYDTYDNLPLKTLAGYEYVKEYCGNEEQNPKWIMFRDSPYKFLQNKR